MARDWGEISGRRFGCFLGHGSLEGPSTWLSPPHLSRHAASPETCEQTQPRSAGPLSPSQHQPASSRHWDPWENEAEACRSVNLQLTLRCRREPSWGQQSCQPSSAQISQPQPICKLFINIKLLIKLDKAWMTQAMHLEQRWFFSTNGAETLDNHRQKERRQGWSGEGRTEGERKKDQTQISHSSQK